MKIKITKSPIFVFIIFAVALELRFAEIFSIKYLAIYANMTLVVVVICSLLFFNSIVNNYIYNTLKPYRNYTNFFLIVMILTIVIITIYSYNVYNQHLINYYSCFRVYLYFMLSVPMIFVFTKQNGIEYFMKAILILTIIYIILCFINSFYYKYIGHLLFRNLQFGLRNGRLRCQAPCTLYVTLPYVFNKIFSVKMKKDKAKWIAVFILFVWFLYYVCMTRMLSLAFYAFLALSLILIPKDTNLRRTILIIYLLVFVVLVASGQIGSVIEYFQSRDETLNDSTEARLNSMRYFNSYAQSNPLFSMGFVSPTNTYYSNIFFGPKRSYFFDDIGIINIYLHYGIVGTIPFLLFVLRILYLAVKIYFINKSPNKAYYLGTVVFMAISQVSLSMFDGQRIMGAVILWALFEYEAYQTSPRSEKDKKRRISIRRNNENHTIQLRVDKSRR